MEDIYHLVLPSIWWREPDRELEADSLAGEGFIHCSFVRQVEKSANKHYADASELWVIRIDPSRLRSPLKVEASGSGEEYPHVYGPINRDAVTAVIPLVREAGRWVLPARSE